MLRSAYPPGGAGRTAAALRVLQTARVDAECGHGLLVEVFGSLQSFALPCTSAALVRGPNIIRLAHILLRCANCGSYNSSRSLLRSGKS